MLRELVKDLENIKGAIANNYNTFPVVYGEKKTKQLSVTLISLTILPIIILLNYPALGLMQYYFYLALIILIFVALYLWQSNHINQYRLIHNILKMLLLVGVFSLIFIDTSLLLEKVIQQLN